MAKNIADFSPGMSGPSEMIDKCEFLWTSSHNPGDSRGTNYGNGCARMCWQENHSYAGDVDIKIFGAGGSTGGSCCCMLGTPASSGAYAFFKVSPVYGKDNAFCWHQYAGGCCRPQSAGEDSCRIWVKDPKRSAGCIILMGGHCACSVCNTPMQGCCFHVCYQSDKCRDQTTPTNSANGRYTCKGCFEQAGAIPASQFWLDSEVTMFPSVNGFITTSKCNNNNGGGQVCKIIQFKNAPAVANGKKEHYMSQSFGGENCLGGWLSSCWACTWFGSHGSHGPPSNYNSVCVAGVGGNAASANGGNCYCGGGDGGGIFVSFYYTLNSEITG